MAMLIAGFSQHECRKHHVNKNEKKLSVQGNLYYPESKLTDFCPKARSSKKIIRHKY